MTAAPYMNHYVCINVCQTYFMPCCCSVLEGMLEKTNCTSWEAEGFIKLGLLMVILVTCIWFFLDFTVLEFRWTVGSLKMRLTELWMFCPMLVKMFCKQVCFLVVKVKTITFFYIISIKLYKCLKTLLGIVGSCKCSFLCIL